MSQKIQAFPQGSSNGKPAGDTDLFTMLAETVVSLKLPGRQNIPYKQFDE